MQIDKRLNLVCPIERETGTIYVHSQPIGREVFKRHFLVIARTFASIYGNGLNVMAGPQVAALMLEKVAADMGQSEDVENGLMAEIRRLSNVVMAGPNGWETLPYQDAIKRGLFSSDEIEETEGTIVFFIVASCMHKKSELPAILVTMTEWWGLQTSLLDCTGFAKSLTTSTVTATSPTPAAPTPPPQDQPRRGVVTTEGLSLPS